jgi:hypothetical protein
MEHEASDYVGRAGRPATMAQAIAIKEETSMIKWTAQEQKPDHPAAR